MEILYAIDLEVICQFVSKAKAQIRREMAIHGMHMTYGNIHLIIKHEL